MRHLKQRLDSWSIDEISFQTSIYSSLIQAKHSSGVSLIGGYWRINWCSLIIGLIVTFVIIVCVSTQYLNYIFQTSWSFLFKKPDSYIRRCITPFRLIKNFVTQYLFLSHSLSTSFLFLFHHIYYIVVGKEEIRGCNDACHYSRHHPILHPSCLHLPSPKLSLPLPYYLPP